MTDIEPVRKFVSKISLLVAAGQMVLAVALFVGGEYMWAIIEAFMSMSLAAITVLVWISSRVLTEMRKLNSSD